MSRNAILPSGLPGSHSKRGTLRVVVIGGNGLIGSKLVAILNKQGYQAIAASPSAGVNTLTGQGLPEALRGASVVVDVSNSPSFADKDVMEFFKKSTANLLTHEERAGVAHHVALSVVGTDRLSESGYFRAKQAQEDLIRGSSVPFTIVRATQFFEFTLKIADSATVGAHVRLAPVHFQPMAADDVAASLERVISGEPLNDTLEVAGPEAFRLDELVGRALSAQRDERTVITDPSARYFNALLSDRTLMPRGSAWMGHTTFEAWLARQARQC